MSRRETIQTAEQVLRSRLHTLVRSLENDLDALTEHCDVRDSIDKATDEEYVTVVTDLASIESHEVREINAALDRIADGQYGTCDDCGKPIPTVRLKAIPYATRCVKCQGLLPSSTDDPIPPCWDEVEDESDDDVEVPSIGYQESW